MISYTPKDLGIENCELLKLLEKNEIPPVSKNGPWIAGGAIRRSLLDQPLDSDIDYFISYPSQLELIELWISYKGGKQVKLEKDDKELYKKGLSISTDSIKKDFKVNGRLIQVIYENYKSIDDVFNAFDLTICQTAFDGCNIFVGPLTIQHLKERKLCANTGLIGTDGKQIIGILPPRIHQYRIDKYEKQGFKADKDILENINNRFSAVSTLANSTSTEIYTFPEFCYYDRA